MEYISVSQAADKWGISDRRVRLLCQQGKIQQAIISGRSYLIPSWAPKPVDGRTRRGKDISPAAMVLLDQIDQKKTELENSPPMSQGDTNQMMRNFLIDVTYHSNALCGSQFTREDTAKLISGSVVVGRSLKEHLQITGYRDAFIQVRQLSSDKAGLSEHLIKELHSLLMIDRPRDKGSYRKTSLSLPGKDKELSPPNLIPAHMEELVKLFNKSKMHWIESAAVFLLNFESIHPFYDGNGRLGLLLLNFLLMSKGYPAVNVRVADKKRYYGAFTEYDVNHNTIPLLQLINARMIERMNSCIYKRKHPAAFL